MTKHVLYIEDNWGDQQIVKDLLINHDYTVHLSDTLTEASEIISKLGQTLDCILLDLSLTNGDCLSHSIPFLNDQNAPIATVLISGETSNKQILSAIKQGAQDFLSKNELTESSLVKAIEFAIIRNKIESDLVKTKKDAIHADAAKENFLHLISHELRSPLNSLLNNIDFLTNNCDLDSEEYSTHFVSLTRSAKVLNTIVEKLLIQSDLSQGEITVSKGYFSGRTLKSKLRHHINDNPIEKNIEINLQIQDNLVIESDSFCITQSLFHLINNAIQHSDGKEIFVYSEDSHTENYSIFVQDSGPGINTNDIDALFLPFNKAKNTSGSPSGNVGLGLSIAKHFAELVRGKISVTNSNEGGACFELSFPKSL